MDSTKELITVAEFLARYSIGRTSFYREIAKNGPLKLRKFGSASRISTIDAEAWAASLPIQAGGQK